MTPPLSRKNLMMMTTTTTLIPMKKVKKVKVLKTNQLPSYIMTHNPPSRSCRTGERERHAYHSFEFTRGLGLPPRRKSPPNIKQLWQASISPMFHD
jgi:hypothetical protein